MSDEGPEGLAVCYGLWYEFSLKGDVLLGLFGVWSRPCWMTTYQATPLLEEVHVTRVSCTRVGNIPDRLSPGSVPHAEMFTSAFVGRVNQEI